jgi:hypothetical protein
VLITIRDLTRAYFGDYHHIRLEVTCRVGRDHPTEDAVFQRVIEKMGVPTADIDSIRDSLVDDFLSASRAYLCSPDFPEKLARFASRQPQRTFRRYGEKSA